MFFFEGDNANIPQQPDEKAANDSQNTDASNIASPNNKEQSVDPGKALAKKLPSLNSPPKSRLAPIAKPTGIDPVEVLREREFRYKKF